MFKYLFLLIFVSLVLGCTPQDSTSEDPKIIKKTLIEMWDSIEQGDAVRYASYIHPDFTQFGEYDSAILVGKDAEVAGISSWVADSEGIHTEMIDPRVKINGETAWITYYWADEGITKGEPFKTGGKSTRIFVKEDGKWLCIHGHYTLFPDSAP